MNDQPYAWGVEHFCEPDATRLYETEPQRLTDPELGYPVKLEELPVPETFCSACLEWFTTPEEVELIRGSEVRPSEEQAE